MAYEPRNSNHGELPDEFCDSLDAYVLGLISIEQMRRKIVTLLSAQPSCCEDVAVAVSTAFQSGHLNGTAYRTLLAEVDLATSEDEPTEWSEDTQQKLQAEANTTDDISEAPPKFEHKISADSGIIAEQLTEASGQPEPVALELTNVVVAETDAPTPNNFQGTQLGNRYVLREQIGSGSMGQVYKALDRQQHAAGAPNSWVAVKIVSPAFAKHPGAMNALRQEAEHGQRLIHPNIIRVFEFDWDTTDQFFITMEWLEGNSLVDILNARRFRPLPFHQARSIVEGLCHGLSHAHEQGIVHADIKPGNVFVTRAGHVKLLDFGIARALRNEPQLFDPTAIGAHTPAYSSCEVLEGQAPEPVDDVYSLASLAYRLLSGRRVFGGATALQAEADKLEPEPIQTLNDQQWLALKDALAWRRVNRTPTIAQFLAKFSGMTAAARPLDNPSVPPQTSEPVPSVPLKYGIPAIAAVLAAIAVLIWWPDQEAGQNAVENIRVEDVQPMASNASPLPVPSAELVMAPTTLATEESPQSVAPDADDELDQTAVADPDSPAAATTLTEEAVQETPQASVAEPAGEPAPGARASSKAAALAVIASERMDDGKLIEPSGDSARDIVASITAIDPESEALPPIRMRLANLMLLEAMVAIADENFGRAEQWIADTKNLGVPAAMTARYEDELTKARETEATRKRGSLGAIFASATPAAILSDSNIDYGPVTMTMPDDIEGNPQSTQSATLAMVLPGGMADTAAKTVTPPKGPPAPALTPLSELEFRSYVEPKHPRRIGASNGRGWVELRFAVDESGYTRDIRVIAAEPVDLFDDAAMNAVRKWRFRPYRINGEPSATQSGVRLRFDAE